MPTLTLTSPAVEAEADIELLKLAAMAVGIILLDRPEVHSFASGVMTSDGIWSPLTDNGDALRLAVKLGLCLDLNWGGCTHAMRTDAEADCHSREMHDGDPYTATRLAIVRCAAEIGRAMGAEKEGT